MANNDLTILSIIQDKKIRTPSIKALYSAHP